MENCDYSPRKITADVLRAVAKWPPPDRPREIRDSSQQLVLRHQPSGYLALYALLGRGKRERVCRARDILEPAHPLTFKMALKEAKVLQGKDAGGHDFSEERKVARAIPTLNDYLEETYGPWVTANRRGGEETLARLKTHFSDCFGKLKLDEITPARMESWRTKRKKKGVKAETINRDTAALRAALSRAVTLKILTENPMAGYEPCEVDRHKRVVRALTAEEEKRLSEALDARDQSKRDKRASGNEWREVRDVDLLPNLDGLYPDALTPAVIVAVDTGMRRGEQLALTWDRVNLKDAEIRIEGETTKTYESRRIPLTDRAVQVLRRWHMQQGRPDSGLVFGGVKSLRRSFYALLEKAEIQRVSSDGRVSWHSLRHTFGSRLGAAGVDPVTIRDLMGHADLKTTQRYLHSDAERKQAAVNRLSEGL